jgi:hypothetical protein
MTITAHDVLLVMPGLDYCLGVVTDLDFKIIECPDEIDWDKAQRRVDLLREIPGWRPEHALFNNQDEARRLYPPLG